jgi:hypothetical protein
LKGRGGIDDGAVLPDNCAGCQWMRGETARFKNVDHRDIVSNEKVTQCPSVTFPVKPLRAHDGGWKASGQKGLKGPLLPFLFLFLEFFAVFCLFPFTHVFFLSTKWGGSRLRSRTGCFLDLFQSQGPGLFCVDVREAVFAGHLCSNKDLSSLFQDLGVCSQCCNSPADELG